MGHSNCAVGGPNLGGRRSKSGGPIGGPNLADQVLGPSSGVNTGDSLVVHPVVHFYRVTSGLDWWSNWWSISSWSNRGYHLLGSLGGPSGGPLRYGMLTLVAYVVSEIVQELYNIQAIEARA